jgi:nickel-dependent lactate racemase
LPQLSVIAVMSERQPMRVTFPYPLYERIPPVDVPDERLLGVWGPTLLAEPDDQAALVRGFSTPISAPRLRDAARGRKSVLILIDDGTRFTPTPAILPHVIDELHAGGLADPQIRFLTAQGTHRKMEEEEVARKLGPLHGRFRVFQHDWKNPAELHRFGTTRDGTPVTANRLVAEADYVIGVGSIVPHRVKGFGGGAKIMFPGVAGPEMQHRNQWEASMQMSETVMGVPDNSMRLRMEEAAEIAGLRYIVNVVLDGAGHIAGCYCGDFRAAFREGCNKSREICAAHMPRRAEIVLIDSYPADRDFWQSAKGLYAATMAVKDGGTIILVSPNPEGVASNHKNVLEIGYRKHAELVAMVQRGEVEDLVGVAILADVAQIIDKAQCIIASPGVNQKDAEKLGLVWAPDGQRALEMAFEGQGRDARVAVLRHGGHILPLADERTAAAQLS